MRKHMFYQPLAFAFVLTLGGVQAFTQSATPQVVAPAKASLNVESLKQDLDAGMQSLVDKKHLAGLVTLVAQHGKVVQNKAYGVKDLATGEPMQLDTIARIYSMTKPIAGAAMMMLYEE